MSDVATGFRTALADRYRMERELDCVRASLDWRFPQIVLVGTRAKESRDRTGW